MKSRERRILIDSNNVHELLRKPCRTDSGNALRYAVEAHERTLRISGDTIPLRVDDNSSGKTRLVEWDANHLFVMTARIKESLERSQKDQSIKVKLGRLFRDFLGQ